MDGLASSTHLVNQILLAAWSKTPTCPAIKLSSTWPWSIRRRDSSKHEPANSSSVGPQAQGLRLQYQSRARPALFNPCLGPALLQAALKS